MEVIVKNRKGDIRHIKKLNKKEYLIWGDAYYMRTSSDMEDGENSKINSIDYEGGPMLTIGVDLSLINNKIKGKILSIEPAGIKELPNCYKLTVE